MKKVNLGPSNVHKAEDYTKTLNGLFDEYMDMIRKDNKDALEIMIRDVKKHIQGTWTDMISTQVDIMILTIKDTSCTLLRESLDQEPMTTSDPDDDSPTGEDIIRMLPQAQSQEVREEYINLFENLSTATHHISVAMANLSALAKKVDTQTFRIILRASAQPLVQININEETLDPARDKPVKSRQESHNEKLKQDILPDATNTRFNGEPANSSTHLLMAAIYLKLKKYLFNEGTQTETSTKFKVKLKAWARSYLESVIWVGEIEKQLKNSKGRKNLNLRRRGRRLLLAVMRTEVIHLADKQVSEVSGG